MNNEALAVIKNPEQNQELHQKIIYALCNLNDYQSYYQERPMDDEEDKKERIEKFFSFWKDYGRSKHLIFINQNKEIFTTEQKEKIKRIFKEVVYTNLFNHILFITLSDEGTDEAIKLKNGKVLINYWSGHVWVDQWKDIKCQYCFRKLLTKEEAIKIWPTCCIHCQDKIIKELDWAEFSEPKDYGWKKPTLRDLEIKEATDKVEYYLKNKTISIEYYTCGNACCACKYKNRKAIYELQFYSDSFDMYCGINLAGILDELEEEEKKTTKKVK